MRGGTAADAMPTTRARGVSPCSRRRFLGSEDHRRGAVVDAGGVAGGDGAGVADDRLELGEIVERRIGARMLVLVDHDRAGLAARRFDRDDLLGEIAGGGGARGALLRAQRERILVLARHLIFLGDVLAGLGHRIDAVARLHRRIDEAPAERGVVGLDRARKRLARLAGDERRPRHRLDPAGDGEIHLAGADGARRIADGVEARGAQPVDGEAGDRLRQPGEQERHARDVAVVLAGLIGAAEEHFVEPRPVGLGVAGDERLDRRGREVVGAHLGERAAVAADRGAYGIADEDVAHRSLPCGRRLLLEYARLCRLSRYLGAMADRVKSRRRAGRPAGPIARLDAVPRKCHANQAPVLI